MFEFYERVVHDVDLANAEVKEPEVGREIDAHIETFLNKSRKGPSTEVGQSPFLSARGAKRWCDWQSM